MDENRNIKDDVRGMTEKELTDLQHAVRSEKQRKYKKKGIQFCGYIPQEYKEVIPLVMDYLMDKNYISKKTMYNLASMAIRQVIDTVLEDMRRDKQKPRTS
jgi:hypothetical protein